jgi:peptidoglycan/LPS O-acetylase OafA/YrhL
VAGFATSTGSAGHAGVTTSSQLTFDLDHSMKAAHHFLNIPVISYIGILSYSLYIWQQLFLLGFPANSS